MRMGTRFTEAMAGTWRPANGGEQPIRFDLQASTPTPLQPLGTVRGELAGTVDVGGLARAAAAVGTIEVSPVEHRRIRYALAFRADDGTPHRLEGWKSIDWRHLPSTWTTLPATVTDGAGAVVGTAELRFAWRDAPALAASFRLVPWTEDPRSLHERRWDGRPGRLEVWYETFTDPVSGTGFWLHHELVAPALVPAASSASARAAGTAGGTVVPTGRGAGGAADVAGTPGPIGAEASVARGVDEGARVGPHVHGWVAVFPPGAQPVIARYGPLPVGPGPSPADGTVRVEPGARRGAAGDIRWDVRFEDGSPPLHAVPAAAWRHPLLPAAHVVTAPSAAFSGSVELGGTAFPLHDAPGEAARIYGHGNAERWAWLHADLGGGDVLEIVAASPRRGGLRRSAPFPMVQLRLGGRDWPALPLLAAARLRCRIGLPRWTVDGTVGDRRLHVAVEQPAERCVAVAYTDPDGAPSTCTNTERADAAIVLERRRAGRWTVEGEWELRATAHAEVGTRP